MHELNHRANIIHKKAAGSNVIIYENHRSILNVLFHLKKKQELDAPLDLITFDYHTDFLPIPDDLIKSIGDFLKNPNQQKLYRMVEFDLAVHNDNWITAGMELDLIGNVFLFNSNNRDINFRKSYQTKRFGTKYLYNMGDVWSALGYQGCLNDIVKKEEYQPLWDDLGWIWEDECFYYKPNRKFALDIDLDCFTTRILDKTVAIPEDLLYERLTRFIDRAYHPYSNSYCFIKDLIKKGEITTICYENDYCGGIRQAQKIFTMVDNILFDSEIGN